MIGFNCRKNRGILRKIRGVHSGSGGLCVIRPQHLNIAVSLFHQRDLNIREKTRPVTGLRKQHALAVLIGEVLLYLVGTVRVPTHHNVNVGGLLSNRFCNVFGEIRLVVNVTVGV